MLKPNNKRAGLASSPGKDHMSVEEGGDKSPTWLGKRPYENAFAQVDPPAVETV